MPIQGAAADLIKLAMIKAGKELKNKKVARMLLQVHDELVFEVKDGNAKEAQEQVTQWMENAVTLSVPLKVSVGIGPNWGAAH
jgi:DNA polymerase-1